MGQVEELTKDWMTITDYQVFMRGKGGATRKISTRHIYNLIGSYNSGKKTSSELGFIPHRITKSEILLIEPL